MFDDNLLCTVTEVAPQDDNKDSDMSTEIDEWLLADVAAAELDPVAGSSRALIMAPSGSWKDHLIENLAGDASGDMFLTPT